MSYTARCSCLFVVIPLFFYPLHYLGWETQDCPNTEKTKENKEERKRDTSKGFDLRRCGWIVQLMSDLSSRSFRKWMMMHRRRILQLSYRWWIVMDRMYYVLSYTLCTGTLHPPSPPGRKNGARGVVCVCSFRCSFAFIGLVAWSYHLWGCWEQNEKEKTDDINIPRWNGRCWLDSWLMSAPSLELRWY